MPMTAITPGLTEQSLSTAGTGTVNGTTFAVPSNLTLFNWQVTYGTTPASATIIFQGSTDNSTFFTLDTSTNTAGEMRTIFAAVKFVRVSQTARSGGSTTNGFITAKANTGTAGISQSIYFPDGTVAAPSISFASETNTGWYRAGSGNMAAAVAGVSQVSVVTGGFAINPASGFVQLGTNTKINDGGASGKLSLTGTTPMLQFGGTTSGFLAWKSTSVSAMDLRTADDSTFGQMRANVTIPGTIASNGTGGFWISVTSPTISSGFGTSPSIASQNGSWTFRINVGTGGVATSGVVGLPTALTGWNAIVQDFTGGIATRVTASSTTTITITGASAWASGSVLIVIAAAY